MTLVTHCAHSNNYVVSMHFFTLNSIHEVPLTFHYRYLRAVSYREFTYLVYGYLGQQRYPLPACAYHAIRKKFLEDKDSKCSGYDDGQ